MVDAVDFSTLTPSDLNLPPKFKPDERWEKEKVIIEQVYDAFSRVDVVFLQAPTGTGKTVIGKAVAELLGGQSLYTCSTKQLQDQFSHDFPDVKVVKGRANYLTQSGRLDEWGKIKKFGESEITCSDCTFTIEDGCKWCTGRLACPYVGARMEAENSRMACLNYSYLLTDINKGTGNFGGRRFVVLDECDLVEREILSHFELIISGKRQAQMGLHPPKKKTVAKEWIRWLNEEAIPTTHEYLEFIPDPTQTSNIREIREWNGIRNMLDQLYVLREELEEEGWVYDGYSTKGLHTTPLPTDPIIFRPVKVNKWGNQVLWEHGSKFLLMSATILSADIMAKELGLEKEWELLDVGSDFPIENRPIHVVNIADMSYKVQERDYLARGIEGVAKLHRGQKILVHCVSYDLAKWLKRELRIPSHNIISHSNSFEKNAALREYKDGRASVLLGVGMERGVDLPDDLCRVQIIAKIPFPNTQDKRVSARLYGDGGRDWYRMQTVRSLIQMTGRGVRSSEDWCVTYILDKQFDGNLWKSHWLFPKWWSEAVDWKIQPARLGV